MRNKFNIKQINFSIKMCVLKFSIYVLLRFKTKMKRTSVCKFIFQNNRTKRCTSQSQEKSGKETQTLNGTMNLEITKKTFYCPAVPTTWGISCIDRAACEGNPAEISIKYNTWRGRMRSQSFVLIWHEYRSIPLYDGSILSPAVP